jgi:heme O synthase-like polyprenyltransferase
MLQRVASFLMIVLCCLRVCAVFLPDTKHILINIEDRSRDCRMWKTQSRQMTTATLTSAKLLEGEMMSTCSEAMLTAIGHTVHSTSKDFFSAHNATLLVYTYEAACNH